MGWWRLEWDKLLPPPRPGVVVEAVVEFRAVRPVRLPSWTGRVVKTLVMREECFSEAARLLGERGSYRPVRVTPLLRLRPGQAMVGRPLYRVKGGRDPVLRPGEAAVALVSYVAGESPSLPGGCEGRVPRPWDGLEYSVREVSVTGTAWIRDEQIRPRGRVLVSLLTPTLLPVKTPVPPVSWGRRLAERLPRMHRLLPTPGYLLAAAARTYLGALAGEQAEDSPVPWVAYLRGETGIVEESVRIEPVTVVYKPGEKPRLIRGPRGSLVLRLFSRRAAEIASILLPTARLLGLGRSRTIGFGLLQYTPLD